MTFTALWFSFCTLRLRSLSQFRECGLPKACRSCRWTTRQSSCSRWVGSKAVQTRNPMLIVPSFIDVWVPHSRVLYRSSSLFQPSWWVLFQPLFSCNFSTIYPLIFGRPCSLTYQYPSHSHVTNSMGHCSVLIRVPTRKARSCYRSMCLPLGLLNRSLPIPSIHSPLIWTPCWVVSLSSVFLPTARSITYSDSNSPPKLPGAPYTAWLA